MAEQQTESEPFPWKFPFLIVRQEFRLIFHRHIRIDSAWISVETFFKLSFHVSLLNYLSL
jgi:hypothetical protein